MYKVIEDKETEFLKEGIREGALDTAKRMIEYRKKYALEKIVN